MQTIAIIPAAGLSQRMGCEKLLLPWRGHTLIEHVLDVWRQGGVDAQIVVVHPANVRLADVCRNAGAMVCIPATPPPQMKHSVIAGLRLAVERLAPRDLDAWLLAPADMPLLSALLVRALVEKYSHSQCSIVSPRSADGRTGHPVLFSWRLAREVAHLPNGLNELLHRHPVAYVEWQDADAFIDVDTQDDYDRLRNRYDPQAERSSCGMPESPPTSGNAGNM
jgi:molybdenum cofactor cytidylyltransferase